MDGRYSLYLRFYNAVLSRLISFLLTIPVDFGLLTSVMDPISAFGAAASAIQFADVGARALVGVIKISKELKEAPR